MADGDDEREPLGDIAGSLGEDDDERDVWERLQEDPETDAGDVWDQLAEETTTPDPEEAFDPESEASVDAEDAREPEGPVDEVEDEFEPAADIPRPDIPLAEESVSSITDSAKIIHGYVMALFLLSGVAVSLAAAVGVLPGHLWIASIPLLVAGLLLSVPVITWSADLWDPAELR